MIMKKLFHILTLCLIGLSSAHAQQTMSLHDCVQYAIDHNIGIEQRKLQEQNAEISAERRSQVGSGDRSERIRTYNFPQGRVTDHRIGMTIYKLDSFLDGEIDEIVDGLITNDQTEKMKGF